MSADIPKKMISALDDLLAENTLPYADSIIYEIQAELNQTSNKDLTLSEIFDSAVNTSNIGQLREEFEHLSSDPLFGMLP